MGGTDQGMPRRALAHIIGPLIVNGFYHTGIVTAVEGVMKTAMRPPYILPPE